MRLADEEVEADELIAVKKFADKLCCNLKKWKYAGAARNHVKQLELTRIQAPNGSGKTNRDTSAQQRKKGRNVGKAYTLTCFICRRYAKEDGSQRRQDTSFWCKECHMPLCNTCRKGQDGGREMSCVEEHVTSTDDDIRCRGPEIMHVRGTEVSERLHLNLHPRKSGRKRKSGE